MIASDNVLLPEPFGPMIACASPLRTTRSIPLRISLSSTLTCRSLISSVDTKAVPFCAPLGRDGGVRLCLAGQLGERHAVERGRDGGLELEPHEPGPAALLADAVDDLVTLGG